jgi:NAD(P)-dependent dehydrogenase (short-subunit alcohol dehydrogenase family)
MVGAAMPGNIPGNFVHNISKAAVIRMGVNLAVELSPYNIRVNTVSPGLIDTPAVRPLLEAGGLEPFMRSILVKRKGEGSDIAQAAVFLCSDEASYITGANLPVDGGWTASGGLGQPDPDTTRIFAEAMAKLSTIPGGPK